MSFAELQQLVDQYRGTLPGKITVAVLKRLHRAPGGPRAAKSALLHELCLYMWPELKQRSVRDISQIVTACCKLKYPSSRFYERCLIVAKKSMDNNTDVASLAAFIDAFSRVPAAVIPRERRQALHRFVRAFVKHRQLAQPWQIAQVLSAVAMVELRLHGGGVQKLVDVLLKQLPRVSPKALGSSLWALASMGGQGIEHDSLLRLVLGVVENLAGASPYAVSCIITSAAALELQVPPDVLQQLLNRMVQTAGEAQPRSLYRVLTAVLKMGHQLTAKQLEQLLGGLISKLGVPISRT